MKRRKTEKIGNHVPQVRDDGDRKDSVVSVPQDMIIEILTRLPPKSLAKFVIVSKLWSWIIRSKDFTDLFMSRSLTRPCFLFTCYIHYYSSHFFYPISQDAPSSSGHHMTSRLYTIMGFGDDLSPPVRGLIFSQASDKVTILNPSTGQFVELPSVKTRRIRVSSFLGYDSVRDEYKVLSMTVLQQAEKYGRPVVSQEHQVFTLRARQKPKWNMIGCNVPHCPATKGLCCNGVVYYGAWSDNRREEFLMVAFDVRLEKFSPFKLPNGVQFDPFNTPELVSYQRTIALVNQLPQGRFEVWVLEDVDKQEWSKIILVVPSWKDLVGCFYFCCRGAISSGEFIFAPRYRAHSPFYYISYDRKEDIARRVEIEEFRDSSVKVFLNHVECPIIL